MGELRMRNFDWACPDLPLNAKETSMKFRPLHDRVVVRRVQEDTKTKGGIIIPDTAQEKPMQGEIIAVGPGGRDETGRRHGRNGRHGLLIGCSSVVQAEPSGSAFFVRFTPLGCEYTHRG